jgi:hypothetical protein
VVAFLIDVAASMHAKKQRLFDLLYHRRQTSIELKPARARSSINTSRGQIE